MKSLELIAHIGDWQDVYRNKNTGIAMVKDGNTGMSYSCHANIDITGSVRGMKKLGYWGKNDRTVRGNGYIYNIDTYIIGDELSKIAASHCQCIACLERRERYLNHN